MGKKKVGIRLPRQARRTVEPDWSYELEALDPVAEIVEIPADTPAEFAEGAGEVDALLSGWGMPFTREIIEAAKRCVVIGLVSVGTDMVDVEAATAAGIVVTNAPDVFIEEVADHAMMLLLALARLTPQMAQLARSDRWYDAHPILGRQPRLLGQTIGFFGFGNVAQCVARRATGFGLHMLACDPYVSELEMSAQGVEPVGFHELLERSDYVSIHAPLNAETREAFDAAAFARMKPTAVLINTARGGLVDEPALIEALRRGEIGGAGLDVLAQEPPKPDNPLLSMDNVLVTPHVASESTRSRPEARRRAGREVALVLQGRWPRSCVNPTVLPRADLERWQPYPMNRGPNR